MNLEARDVRQRTPIFEAVGAEVPGKDLNAAARLIKRSARLDAVDETAASALHVMASWRHDAGTRLAPLFLRELAPLVNLCDAWGRTALM